MQIAVHQQNEKSQSLIAKSENIFASRNILCDSVVPSTQLFNNLSFSHLSLLLPIGAPLKRAFYETMAIFKMPIDDSPLRRIPIRKSRRHRAHQAVC